MPEDEDILAFGATGRGLLRGRFLPGRFLPGRRRLVGAGVIVAVMAAAAALLTCYAVTHTSASPPTAPAPAPVKIDGIYLQEQGNGTILLPAALRHAFRPAPRG